MKNRKIDDKTFIVDIAIILAEIAFIALFVVALINNIDIMLAISSVGLLGVLFVTIVRPLVSNRKIAICEWVEIGFNFVVAISLIIVFASVSNSSIKDAVIQITASVLGGLLTLYGVAITIKYTHIDKMEDEIKKAKPIIFPISDNSWGRLSEDKKNIVFLDVDEEKSNIKRSKSEKSYHLKWFCLANSDASLCSLYGILINGRLIKFKYEQVLSKNSYNLIYFDTKRDGYRFLLKEKITEISLLVCDMLENVYSCLLRYEIDKNKKIAIQAILDTEILK